MDLARRYPKVIEELEKYVPGASSRLTTAKDPKPKYMTTGSEHSMLEKLKTPRPSSSSEHQHHWPKYMTTSSEHSMVEKLKLVPSSSSEHQHHLPEYSPTSSEHSTKAKSKSSLEEGTEHKTD